MMRAWSSSHLVAALCIALALPGWWVDRRMFFASWLAAWWTGLGLVLGALVHLWLHRLTGGRWGEALRPQAAALARRMPRVLLLFLPLLAGLPLLYPWLAEGPQAWARGIDEPAFIVHWFAPEAFALRLALYAIAWWWLARPSLLHRQGRVALALVVHLLVGSLAAIDLLMSLLPVWTSTAFGLVVLTAQALGASALLVLLAAARAPAMTAGLVGRDLGNLLMMWLLLWAYLAFMEFLIIWAEDLPREIAWYLPRLRTGWQVAALVLVLLQFALPLLLLLWRANKQQPRRLAGIAALLLAAQWLNSAWLVLPSVDARSVHGLWLMPLLALGFGAWLLGGLDAPAR